MSKDKFPLAKREGNELKRPFPMIQDLFALAKKSKIEGRESSPVELPEKFYPIVVDFPGKYFIVSYEDRRDNYYQEDTRGQIITLSSVENRLSTDDRTQEFVIKQMNKSRADRIEVSLRQAVMDKSFENINQAEGEDLEQSHGTAEFIYEMDENGQKYPQKMQFNRLDEGLFKIGEVMRPVRWLRDLEIVKEEEQTGKIKYMDYYLIKNDGNPVNSIRADVKSTITGSIDKPQGIVIEVGSGPKESARILIDDKKNGVKFLVHPGVRGKDPLQIVKEDPVYAPLFEESPDVEAFKAGLMSRIQNLKEDWDKPQSVYATANVLEQKAPALEG